MAKNGNSSLERAKKQKKDEFYTRLEDIERELAHYKAHFKGKTVLCNCDDPRISNFFHYFSYQFEIVGQSLTLADMKPIRERLGRNDGGPTFYIERGGKLLRLYDRIVIRRRK